MMEATAIGSTGTSDECDGRSVTQGIGISDV
jgi:hypothetical protein